MIAPLVELRPASQELLVYALGIGALELVPEGRKLKSGRVSPYFFNSGLFNTGQSLGRLADAYAEVVWVQDQLDELHPEVIFGPAYKGIQLAAMTACMLAEMETKYEGIGSAYNRKEAKDHGESGLLVGYPLAGKRVLIVDDVITDGASKREALGHISASGGTAIGCVIAFDRQERGADENDSRSAAQVFQAEFGIPVYAVTTLDDLILLLEEGPAIPKAAETLPKILAYRDQYGRAPL